jgi:hypothetical protein
MEAPELWTGPKERIEATRARLTTVERDLAAAYERWALLEG